MRNKIGLSILLVVTLVLMLLTASQTFVYASSLEHEYHENLIEQRQEETTKEIKVIYEEDHKPKEKKPKPVKTSPWKNIGMCRITTYCPWCNDPPGTYNSSSGAQLYEGCAACNWLAIGTKIRINGNEYTIVDTCGTDAIDIFVDTSYCQCHTNYYTNVEIYK